MHHRCLRVRTTRFLTFAMCLTAWMMLLTSGIAAQDDQLTATATELSPEVTVEITPTDAVPTDAAPTEITATTAATLAPTAQPAQTATSIPSDRVVYIVQRGDTLARIAVRFGTTVSILAAENNIVNVDLIFVGQRLLVPGQASPTGTPAASVTPLPTAAATLAATSTIAPTATIQAGRTYVVQVGDTLAKIAVRFNVTLAQLLALNPLENPNIILPGQVIVLPATATEPAITPTSPSSTAVPLPTATPVTSMQSGFAYGVSAFYVGQESDAMSITNAVYNLGVGWVRLTVNWRDIEAVQGQPDFSALDEAIRVYDTDEGRIKILLTVTTSPDWARSVSEEQGPPDDFNHYARFMETLAGRYAGVVDAYQVWYEPNLRREWFSDVHQIGAGSYMGLLRGAHAAVKRADPSVLVIAAGLAPTGYHDGVNAINDRVFLTDLYAANVMAVSDAIAAHPGGWANPPDATCCAASEGVLTHYQDRSFFFKDTLDDYRAIMIQNRDDRPLWVTKFGWGSSADTTPPGEGSGYIYVTYTDLNEQAAYAVRAFEMGEEMEFVGPMFLDNLNGCQTVPLKAESCYTSLGGPTELRPVYAAVQAIDKSVTP